MPIYSHPNYLLKDHLNDVTNNMLKLFKEKDVNYSEWGLDSNEVEKLVTLIGLSHDFGKYSVFFQEYLLQGKHKNNPLKNHSFISSIAFMVIWNKIKSDSNPLLTYAGFNAIMRHHSNLTEMDFYKNYVKSDMERLSSILDGTDEAEWLKIISDRFNLNYDNISFIQDMKNEIRDFSSKLEKEKGVISDNLLSFFVNKKIDNSFWNWKSGKEDFLFIEWIFSMLIYSDKFDAIFRTGLNDLPFIDKSNYVQNYKKTKNFKIDSDLNEERERVYQIVHDKSLSINLENKLFTLPMNTGYGKTLASLNFSFQIQNRLRKEKGYNSKIIYAMPYTSIIEQNYNVVYEVLKTNQSIVDSTDLLKHHYLSSPTYQREKEEIDNDKGKFLTYTWDSQLIFTTFVQLLETFFTNKNNMLVRFPNMVNSIIILDEIQSIEPELFHAFEEMSLLLSKFFNIYFVSCSATQPYFLKSYQTSLVENYLDFYQTDRTKMIIHRYKESAISYNSLKFSKNEFIDFCKELIVEDKNYLIMVNTKKMALFTYFQLKDFLEKEGYTPFLLSNLHIPLHKKMIIEEVRDRLDNANKTVLISTQLIEAGVDVDFDVSIRDFSLLPNLIQSVGRVNRNFRHNNFYGEMYLVNIENQCNLIYDPTLLEITFESLKKYLKDNSLYEPDYILSNSNYFRRLREIYSQEKGNELINQLIKMNFNEVNFKLIEEYDGIVSLFVPYDDYSLELWEQYVKLPYAGLERKKEYDKFKVYFSQYTIKLTKKELLKSLSDYTNKIFELHNIHYLDSYTGAVYSYDTGFMYKLEKEEVIAGEFM